MSDRLWQFALRWGFQAARMWWRVRRPAHRGALVAVWVNGQVLCVKQSYRERIGWPGGGVHRGEDPRNAAQRELREELGLELPLEMLRHADCITGEWDFRRDTVDIFEVVLDVEPKLTIDNREIVAAWFVSPEELLGSRPAPFIEAYLRSHACAPAMA